MSTPVDRRSIAVDSGADSRRLAEGNKTRVFGRGQDVDPVTKVNLFFLQILRLWTTNLDSQPGMPGEMALLVSQ